MLLVLRSLVTPEPQAIGSASIAMAVVMAGGPLSTDLALAPDTFDPEAVVSQNFVTMRATAPANLGDADASTETARTTTTVLGPASTAGSAVTTATAMADPSLPFVGAISGVIFRTLAYIVDVGPYARLGSASWGVAPATRMYWEVGANNANSPLINDDPTIDTGTPAVGYVIRANSEAPDAGDAIGIDFYCHTALITTQPNGQPWDQTALNALANVKVMYDYPANTEFADLNVCEIFADVYGPLGSKEPPLVIDQFIGHRVVGQEIRNLTE